MAVDHQGRLLVLVLLAALPLAERPPLRYHDASSFGIPMRYFFETRRVPLRRFARKQGFVRSSPRRQGMRVEAGESDEKSDMWPRVIYINGPSSSGKTTLRKNLQERLGPEVTYLSTGIDVLLREMLPDHCFLHNDASDNLESQDKEWFYWQEVPPSGRTLRVGPKAKAAWMGLVGSTVGLLEAGNRVIVDDVCFEGLWQLREWKSALAPYPALFVGLTCPPSTLDTREIQRGDRMMGSARIQAGIVHGQEEGDMVGAAHAYMYGEAKAGMAAARAGGIGFSGYDLIIDSAALDPDQCVEAVLNACAATTISRDTA